MAINKLITSEGNVQFIFGDTGKIINVHPFHIYTSFNEDTVSFILIAMPKTSGLAIFTSKAEDLEVNGEIYSFDDLPDAIAEAFAIAGAQMRYEVVDELPETGQTNTIYLVPKQGGSGFDEYIYIRDTGEWELIGDTDIELARYLKKEDFNAYSAATKLKIDYISGATDYVSGAVDTEVARATSAETALQTVIDNETSARTEADAILQTNIDNETSARTSADTALQTALDNEISARTSADTALQTAIDNETSARTEADATLQTNIDNEASARTEADNALQSAIDTVSGNVETETSRATSAETELQTAIDNEASARTSADSVISGAVDTLSSNKADKANAVASAVYVSSSTTIDLKNVSGEVISQVDASDFIVDGMVEDVRIENGYLIIDFNTASGIEDIEIPLTDIFNPANYYDKDDIDDIVSGINESISAVNDSFSAYSTSAEVTAEINAAVSGKADADDVYTKTEVDDAITAATDDMATQSWVSEQGYVTEYFLISNEYVQENVMIGAIDRATSGLQETLSAGTNIDITDNVISVTGITIETSSAITSGDTNAVAGGAVYDKFDEVEQVTARALVDLNESLSGKADTSALSGYVATSAVTSAVTSGSTSVVTSGGVYQQMGGLKLVRITQNAYDNLQTKDSNTLYIISD